MNLTELQKELRTIENHISFLQKEIEKMKPQPEEEKKATLDKITEVSIRFPVGKGKYIKFEESVKKSYIKCLSYFILADENVIFEKLLYVCRLAQGMGLPMSGEDVLRSGMEMDKNTFEKICLDLKSVKYSFLTDILILTNLSEKTNTNFELIADIATIYECGKDEMQIVAKVAKAFVCDDFEILENMPIPRNNRWMGEFKHHLPTEWIEGQRIECGVVNSSSYILNRKQAGTIVKKGEELILFEEVKMINEKGISPTSFYMRHNGLFSGKRDVSEKCLLAPCDGIVFFIEENDYSLSNVVSKKHIYVYVVSYFDDYGDFCKWHNKNKGVKQYGGEFV